MQEVTTRQYHENGHARGISKFYKMLWELLQEIELYRNITYNKFIDWIF